MLYRIQNHELYCVVCNRELSFRLEIEYNAEGKEITSFGFNPRLEEDIFQEFRRTNKHTTWRPYKCYGYNKYTCSDECRGKRAAQDHILYGNCSSDDATRGAIAELQKALEKDQTNE